jgi:2-dehydropantoate 2-reductase
MGKRIAVIGSGAVGGYLGGHLARTGQDVTLIDPWPEHIETIRRNGLHLSGMTEEESYTVKVPTMHLTEVQSISKQKPIDIAIVSVKSYDTEWATMMIRPYLSPNGFVLSAQNSINEEKIASVVGWGRTVGCIVANNFGVDLYEAGHIRRTMPRDFKYPSLFFGEVHGRVTPRVEELRDIVSAMDGSAVTTNLWGDRWSKLCVNGMRNGVSAATGMGGNERDSHEVIRRVVIRLGGEAVRVGRALGYELEKITGIEPLTLLAASENNPKALAEVEAHIARQGTGAARSNLQRPSMAQDMQKGRRTEISEINGFIVQKGKEAGCEAPTHQRIVDVVRKVEAGTLSPRPELLFFND